MTNTHIATLERNKFDEYGNVKISKQDQYTEIIDLHLTIFIDNITITSNTSIDDTVVSISCASTPVIGNMVCFKEDNAFYQAEIISITTTGVDSYDITLDTPLDYAFTISGGCSLNSPDLNVDGSSTPIIASVSPLGLDVDWDITRMILTITDNVAMDDAKFGGIPALQKGIVFRRVDGTYKNIFNVKSNQDLTLHGYDLSYSDKAPAGLFGLGFRRSFSGDDKNGVTIRLASEGGDEFQLIIQDNLTELSSFQAVVQGHVVD